MNELYGAEEIREDRGSEKNDFKKATNPYMENMAYSYHSGYGFNGDSELSNPSPDKTGNS